MGDGVGGEGEIDSLSAQGLTPSRWWGFVRPFVALLSVVIRRAERERVKARLTAKYLLCEKPKGSLP